MDKLANIHPGEILQIFG